MLGKHKKIIRLQLNEEKVQSYPRTVKNYQLIIIGGPAQILGFMLEEALLPRQHVGATRYAMSFPEYFTLYYEAR